MPYCLAVRSNNGCTCITVCCYYKPGQRGKSTDVLSTKDFRVLFQEVNFRHQQKSNDGNHVSDHVSFCASRIIIIVVSVCLCVVKSDKASQFRVIVIIVAVIAAVVLLIVILLIVMLKKRAHNKSSYCICSFYSVVTICKYLGFQPSGGA